MVAAPIKKDVAKPPKRRRRRAEPAQARAKRERDSEKHQAIGRSHQVRVVTHKPCLERIRKYGLLATTPAAPQRRLRDIFLMSRPPLLWELREEGSISP